MALTDAKYEKLAVAVRGWLRKHNEDEMIRSFDKELVRVFGVQPLKDFVGWNRHRHAIAHELAKQDKRQVIAHLVYNHEWDLNVQRASDGCTPLHLAVWHGHLDMFGMLLRLGADASIKNSHGEYPERLFDPELQTCRARILGARDGQELLCIVQKDLERFDGTDIITAYYQLAHVTCYHNAKADRWQLRESAFRADAEEFLSLREACKQTLRRTESSDAGCHWELMLRCLVMLPDAEILQCMVTVASTSTLPLQSWGVNTLGGIAWGMAKLPDGQSLWNACHGRLGDELAERVELLDELYLGLVCWAFGKGDGRHPALFAAVARRLEIGGANLLNSMSLGRIAWAFARAGEQHPWAFRQLAMSCLRLLPELEEQTVAMILWGYARLGFKHSELFRALLDRVGVMIYEKPIGHAVTGARACTWSKVYYAYMFCRKACPGALSSLSPRFASDLHKISTGCHHDGLSLGSGVETAASLREMDELIAEMGEHAPMEDLGVDSLENDPRNLPSPEVAAANASQAATVAERGNTFSDRVVMLKFARSPRSFFDALMSAPELEPCRRALTEAGLEITLFSGAKAFVHPEQYGPLLDSLRETEVTTYSSHVLVSEDFERDVLVALARLPKSQGVALRSTDSVNLLGWEQVSQALSFSVKRTFIHVRVPPSVASACPSRRAQSS